MNIRIMSSCWCHTITKYHAYDEPKWQTTTGHTWRVSRCCGGNVCDYDALGPHERMNIHLKWKPITEHRWEVLDFISMCCCIFYFNFQKILRIIVSSWHQVISCVHANHVHHQTYTQESAFKYCLCTCCDAERKKNELQVEEKRCTDNSVYKWAFSLCIANERI